MFPESFEVETPIPDLSDLIEISAPANDAEVETAEANHDMEYLNKLRSIHSFSDREDPDVSLKPSSNRRKQEPAINDQQVKDMLDNGQADTLVNSYRAMCVTFPFVPVDDFASASELHAAKPMLFLSIITVAAWDNHKLQRHLDRVYRKELADHTFIRPRRTLSLLQSIIVYLSRYVTRHWNSPCLRLHRYHFVFSHKTQQIYFMQTTANGLALDLGLHQRSSISPIELPGRPAPPKWSVSEQLERQRTLLGCYYLSSL